MAKTKGAGAPQQDWVPPNLEPEMPIATAVAPPLEPKPPELRPVREIINDLIRELHGHPEAKILIADWEQNPGEQIAFKDTHWRQQRVATLRILFKWR